MNERYKTLLAVRNAALLELPPVSLSIISPPKHGKTVTKNIFLSENIDCYEVTSMSDTAFGDELLELINSRVLIIDDPLNWNANDFVNAIRYFKALGDGFIITPRKTKFKRDNVAVPANIHTVVMMHPKQWNAAQNYYSLTGFEERALLCWSSHSKETMQEMQELYMHRKKTTPLPKFIISDFELLKTERELTGYEVDWIVKSRTIPWQSITSIGRAISESSFESLREYLCSNSKRVVFMEEIMYEEVET